MRRRFMSKNDATIFDTNNYLTIEALEDEFSVFFEQRIEYGIDGKGWKILEPFTYTPLIKAGQTLSFRGELTPTAYSGIGRFNLSKGCNLKGNCLSLIFGDDAADNLDLSGKDSCFYSLFEGSDGIKNVSPTFLPATTLAVHCYNSMFYGCTSLTTAPELPATTLANHCYSNMFYGCTSLTAAPKLPATTLAYGCYGNMFYNCTSLTVAPELPATTLADYCYDEMFRGCSKLNYIKMLATDISAPGCLSDWVSGVASTGTFVKNSAMTSLPTGYSGIPRGWAVQNA